MIACGSRSLAPDSARSESGQTAFRSASVLRRACRVISPCPVDWWEARRQSCEFAQALADVAEAQAWLEPLHQSEDVAFGFAGRIPPPASGIADDQDFAFASPYFRLVSCSPSDPVSRAVGFARAPRPITMAQFIDSGSCPVMSVLAFERTSWAQWPWACLRPCPARRPRGGRAARARGTRGSLRRTLRDAAGASGSHPPLLRFHAKA